MTNQEQEVTLKDIVKRIRQIFTFLLSKWVIIVIFGVTGGVLGFLYAWNAKPKFTASLNFVLSANSSSGGSLLGLANQFGLNLGNDNDNVFTGDNIIALMKSRRMVQQALFIKPDSSKESLINIFVKNNKIDEQWQHIARTKNAYPFPDSANAMSLVQDSLARAIYTSIINDVLEVSQPDKNQSIYAVTSTSSNELFSFYLTKYLVSSTSAFYIDTKTSTAKQNLSMLQQEADSIRRVLGGAITLAGSQTDYTFNLNPAYQVQRSGATQSLVSATEFGQAYGQVLQSLEVAKITLQKETPLYQVIDEPTLPLEAKKPGKLTSLIIGGILAGLLICFFLIIKKIFTYLK
jgi:uncharacterized protein involved in exopolysaccharide biosynthesis